MDSGRAVKVVFMPLVVSGDQKRSVSDMQVGKKIRWAAEAKYHGRDEREGTVASDITVRFSRKVPPRVVHSVEDLLESTTTTALMYHGQPPCLTGVEQNHERSIKCQIIKYSAMSRMIMTKQATLNYHVVRTSKMNIVPLP